MQPVPILIHHDAVKLTVRCNFERMTNVLLHLVQNAQEATADTGKVTITVSSDQANGLIEILDSGHGMSDSFINNELFRPFKTTKGNAGMGIGVYESKDYIESLGGKINVSSEVGTGTKFRIILPAINPNNSSQVTSDNG